MTVAVLLPDQVRPFNVIAQRAIAAHGTASHAAEAIGVSSGTLRRLTHDGYLTDKSARLILAWGKANKRKDA